LIGFQFLSSIIFLNFNFLQNFLTFSSIVSWYKTVIFDLNSLGILEILGGENGLGVRVKTKYGLFF